jgi:hypothetical protein
MPRGIFPRKNRFATDTDFQNALSEHKNEVAVVRKKKEYTPDRIAKRKAACVRYEARHKLARIEQKLKARYGITKQQYDGLFERQQGKCAICNQKFSSRKLDVDHAHTTNLVRGLLCRACNIMIGLAKERPEIFHAAANYLETVVGISPPPDFVPSTW